MLTWLLPAAGRAAVMLRITFPSGRLQEKGAEGLGWKQEGLAQLQTLDFYLVEHSGKQVMLVRNWRPVWSLWASSFPLHAGAHYCKTADGRWWYNLQSDKGVHIYASCRRWEKESLCRKCNVIWRNMLLDHYSWPFHCSSIFDIPSIRNPLVSFFLDFLSPHFFFFFLSWRGHNGGRMRPWQCLW